jgi:hypothetical protein
VSFFDTYTAILRNEPVDGQAVIKLYIHSCDLYSNLALMGQPFDSATNQAKVIRDAAAERLRERAEENNPNKE